MFWEPKNGRSELGKTLREESCDGNEEGSGKKSSVLATLSLRKSLAIQCKYQANIWICEFRFWGKYSRLVLEIC